MFLVLNLLLSSAFVSAGPHVPKSLQAGFSYNELFARYECSGQVCGWDNQYCCSAGSQCYTSNDIALCSTVVTDNGKSGYWSYSTTTFIETDLQTITSTMSSYIDKTSEQPSTPTAACNWALNESPCGKVCCSGTQYCVKAGVCADTGVSSSDRYSSSMAISRTAIPPLRPTTSAIVTTTQTQMPTTTVPFQSPVVTGANVTITGDQSNNSGLSGGDIAGIVIGVLVGLFLLGLLCFYCCLKGLLDGVLALFGFGKRRRERVTEVEEYERRSHRGGRTWYGAARPPPPSSRRSEKRESNHFARDAIGIGAGLAALWAVLGLKRRAERKKEERYTAYSDVTYSSDYYTSASSASTDERRPQATRDVHRSQSRRG